MSVYKKPDGTWFVHWRDEFRKRHAKSFGKGKEAKNQAEAFDHQMRAQKKRKESTVPDKKQKLMRLDELVLRPVNNMIQFTLHRASQCMSI